MPSAQHSLCSSSLLLLTERGCHVIQHLCWLSCKAAFCSHISPHPGLFAHGRNTLSCLLRRYILGSASLQVLSCRALAQSIPQSASDGLAWGTRSVVAEDCQLWQIRGKDSCNPKALGGGGGIAAVTEPSPDLMAHEALHRNLAAWLCFEGMSYGLFPNKQGQTYLKIGTVPELSPEQLLAVGEHCFS